MPDLPQRTSRLPSIRSGQEPDGSKRRRIAFCAYDFPRYLAGGPNTWVRRLLPDLRAWSFDVHPLIIYSGQLEACPLIAALEDMGFPVRAVSRSDAQYVEDQVRWLLAQLAAIQPHVFVANLVTPAFYAARWIRAAGIPAVGVFHSGKDFCDGMTARFVAGPKRDSFDAVVCVSEAIRSRISRSNPNHVEIVRIPCGAPVPDFVKKALSSQLRVLYLGRIAHEAKRALDVAKAFCLASKEVSGTSFTLVGAGPDEDELTRIILESGAQDSVQFLGAVPPEEIPAVLKQHDVIVLLSDYEGMPVALLEGMAHGLVPVCLAEASGIDELLKDGSNGLIVRDRGADFVAALQRLQADPSLLQRLSLAARGTVEREYASGLNHERWAELLERLSARARPRIFRAPRIIRLPAPEPSFGSEDTRTPSAVLRFSRSLGRAWFELRQRARPRSRLRAMLAREQS
jgi:colanic acid/amylovoran biosynthesis glycosyltransferase